MAGEPPTKKAKAAAQDFIKGWPHTDLLTYPQFKKDLDASFKAGLERTDHILNYGDKANGAYMAGHPEFRKVLAEALAVEYGKPVDWQTLFITGGCSSGTDICARMHCKHGDLAVTEAPTYYLGHNMFRDRGLELMEVPIEADGMDLVALEKTCKEQGGKVKLVYTVPVHHNPTGVTMSNEKRKKLVELAKTYNFKILADEAYQLLSFEDTGVVPLFYHDDPADPRVLSCGTFSKLIGPGLKVGWVQAAPSMIKPLQDIGFIDSGNNPVIFASGMMQNFISSGGFHNHLMHVQKELAKKKDLLVSELTKAGYEPHHPKGGYFVWCKVKEGGKRTGRTGKGMSLNPPDAFENYMRLCFAWLTEEQIIEGIQFLKEE
jgi:DNA-binding transcriptional MocR family regulator